MWEGASGPIVYSPPEGREYKGGGLTGRHTPPADDSFVSIVDRRVSARSFVEGINVPDSAIKSALRVARLAPSAGNLQAYQVVVVRSFYQKAEIARAALGQMWIATAPVVLVFLADPARSEKKYHDRGRLFYCIQDATIAAAYAQLAFEAAGFSSCWVGAFREDLVADAVGARYGPPIETEPLTEDAVRNAQKRGNLPGLQSDKPLLRPVVVMPVGTAAERHRRNQRRSLREFVHDGYIGKEGLSNGSSSSAKRERHSSSRSSTSEERAKRDERARRQRDRQEI